MAKNDGGQAFPKMIQGSIGMTLRDYFAGQVVSGDVSSGNDFEWAAKKAYAIADAMLVEREKS